MQVTTTVQFDQAEIAAMEVLDTLLRATYKANNTDSAGAGTYGHWAQQRDYMYGGIHKLLLEGLTEFVSVSMPPEAHDQERVAQCILNECYSNGEGIGYNVQLYIEGVIHV